jgi:hypothetical protein
LEIKKKVKKKKSKSKKSKKPSKNEGDAKITKAEASILKSLKSEFEIVTSKVGDLIPYLIKFIHKGLQYITGGIPGGIFMEIHGPSQCLAEGTLVATPCGPKPINKLKIGEEVFGYNSDGTVSPSKVKKVHSNGIKTVNIMSNGHHQLPSPTDDHVFLVNNIKNGKVMERNISEIKKNQKLKIVQKFVDYKFGDKNEEHAYAIGAILGDGCSRQITTGIHISSSSDKIPEKVRKDLGAKFCYRNSSEGNHTYVITNKKGKGVKPEPVKCNHYDNLIKGKYAYQKSFPEDTVLSWNRESILRFIAGLIDTDGSVHLQKNKYLSLTFSSSSKDLAVLFQTLIYKLYQIKPRLITDSRKDKRDMYDVRIGDAVTVCRILKELNKHIVTPSKKYKKLYGKLKSKKPACRVGIKVTNRKKAKVYDITIDNETNLYVLHDHGLVTHNCGKSYVMMELGAKFIQAGGWYLQADVERAYKRRIGRKLGLEGQTRFIKTKERNMQKLFKLMQKFVIKIRKYDKDCPILLGVDSFNPLQINETMKELEKELKSMEDTDGKVSAKDVKGYAAMRKNAAFSDLMRDFIQFIEEHKVTFLLLNQERKKHGIVFGDSRTTNADEIIQFYASLRLRGSLGAKLKRTKDSKKIIGRKVYWETIKSRHPEIPPFMKTETEIIYKEGIRPYSGLAELLDVEEVIKLCQVDVPAAKKGTTKKVKGFQHGRIELPLTEFNNYVDNNPEILEIEE